MKKITKFLFIIVITSANFVLADASSPSEILSLPVNKEELVVNAHYNLNENDAGSILNFVVTSSTYGQLYSSSTVATTTGEFYYSWTFPAPSATNSGQDIFYFYADIMKDSTILHDLNVAAYMDTSVIGYPGYSTPESDSSVRIGSSYNYLIQSLGRGLSGPLNRIDVQTSNPVDYYGSRPFIRLVECDSDTITESICNILYQGTSDDLSLMGTSTQGFYFDPPIILKPEKYYYFKTSGNNQYNVLVYYLGTKSDTVDGECYHVSFTQTIPCLNVSDLYFRLYGITKQEIPEPEGYSSILFLPGLEASRLYLDEEGSENQLWEPNRKLDVEKLYMNEDGTSVNSGIYTRDIIKETNTPISAGMVGQNIYKSFATMMDDMVATTSPSKMAKWVAYAYDWRYGVEDILSNGTAYEDGSKSLITVLGDLASTSNNGKVTIIAHSNGGLLAKVLLKKLQEDKANGINDLIDKIDNLILVASPQIGTAGAMSAILHGYNQKLMSGVLLDEEHARELGKNMESGYGLLPSAEYINRVSASPITFVDSSIPSGVTTNFINHYGSTIDSFLEFKNFLLGEEGRENPNLAQTNLPIKLSSQLLVQSENLHSLTDPWTPPESLRVIEIAGWGLDTIASFEYYPKFFCTGQNLNRKCGYVLDEKPKFTIDGDETVIEPSAHYMSETKEGVEKYWVDIAEHNNQLFLGARKNRKHKDILEIDSLNNFIKSVIQKLNITFDTVLKDSKPTDTKNRFRVSIHSPVTVGAYDVSDNFTGKICPETSDFCYVKEEIPNSSYLEFGEGKYLNIQEENLQKIILQGTDTGTFTLEMEKIYSDGTATTTKFIDIPVTEEMKAEVVIDSETQNPEMKLDVNGDGVADVTIEPENEFNPLVYLQIMRKTIEGMDINRMIKTLILKKIDDTIKMIQKGKINKIKLKIEFFKKFLHFDSKNNHKWPGNMKKGGRLSQEEIQVLINMLNTLLNNLGK